MRFLSQNLLGSYNNQNLISASSGDPYNAFSDTTKFTYESDGQATNGDTVALEQNFAGTQSLDTIVVLLSNFNDFKISTATGGAFTDVTGNATLTISQDGFSRLYKFATPISFSEIKFEIDNTIIPDEEKRVGAILGMTEIGSIERFNKIKPKGVVEKKKLKLESGGVAVLNKGDVHWQFGLNTDLVTDQVEIDIVETIQNITTDFFFWINDNYDGQETVKQPPYRFEDFIRCAYTGTSNPMFYKNFLNLNANNKLKFEQTAKINYFNPTV